MLIKSEHTTYIRTYQLIRSEQNLSKITEHNRTYQNVSNLIRAEHIISEQNMSEHSDLSISEQSRTDRTLHKGNCAKSWIPVPRIFNPTCVQDFRMAPIGKLF